VFVVVFVVFVSYVERWVRKDKVGKTFFVPAEEFDAVVADDFVDEITHGAILQN